jgi:hypothetical protein
MSATITPQRWQQIQALFDAALARTVPERDAFLAETCAGDPALRAAVLALLAHEAELQRDNFLPSRSAPIPFAPGSGNTALAGGYFTSSPSAPVTFSPAPAPAAASLPPLPDCEVRGELGRGGMGVIYQVWQARLNRMVALKVISARACASPEERARFRTEAEALARLQHPNIVQIHELGEHNDQPYLVLELVEGGSLSRKLAGAPFPPPQAARLIETLARAMHYAHGRGVVHRDLTPSNVLLAEDGTPKITDFGLAKKLDEVGQTASGAILGTPSYMAPEQARGQSKEIGPATDVYALGAILYECLTGRPPFKAATTLDTLQQVVRYDPLPPRQLQPGVPRDLETICLKSLQKEARKRYGSAADLAEDLRRFQAGEPIAARPVGTLERGWRWCRRNPVVAGLLTAVAAAMLLGTAVSWYFAADASRQADRARANEADAKQKEADAVAARNDLARTAEDLKRSRDEVETTLARSLLRPLALQVQPGQTPPLSEPEVGALWELAASRDERLGVRFVQEALRGPVQTRQLRGRALYALQAAVALDDARRAKVEKVLAEGLQAPGSTPEQQVDVALTLAQLGVQDSALAGKVAAILTRALSRRPGPFDWQQLAQSLAAVAARMEPKEAAATLTRAISRTRWPPALQQLAESLSAVAARMEPKEAAVVCGQAAAALTLTMAKATDWEALAPLARGLSAVAARMEPKEAAAVCGRAADALTLALARTTDTSGLWHLAQGLSAVSAWMEPKAAAGVCGQAAALTLTLARTTDADASSSLARGVSALAPCMEPTEAAEVAATLTRAMTETTNEYRLQQLAQGLSAVADRMEPKAAGKAAATLTRAMAKTVEPFALRELARGLSAVAGRLEPEEAVVVCGQAAATLTQALSGTTDWQALPPLAQGLSAAATRMGPKEAGEAAAALAQALSRTTAWQALPPLAQGLSAVAARMEPKAAAVVCGQTAATLTQTLAKTADPFAMQQLAEGLAAVAGRMEPKDADVAASTLAQAMANTPDGQGLPHLARGLTAVAARMGPEAAAEAAASLARATAKTTNPFALGQLAQGLSAVAARLKPEEAAPVCARVAALLPRAMTGTTNTHGLRQLAQGLSALAGRMEPKEAGRVCGQAAATLGQTMSQTTDGDQLQALVAGLTAVAGRLEAKEAAAVSGQAAAAVLGQALSTRDPNALSWLPEGLSAILLREDASRLAQRGSGVAGAVGVLGAPGSVLIAPVLLRPLRPPLPAQTLVDVLKHPSCVGEARRLVLDELQRHSQRPFADQWEFVRFAREQKLDLDLKTPPQRPGSPAVNR